VVLKQDKHNKLLCPMPLTMELLEGPNFQSEFALMRTREKAVELQVDRVNSNPA